MSAGSATCHVQGANNEFDRLGVSRLLMSRSPRSSSFWFVSQARQEPSIKRSPDAMLSMTVIAMRTPIVLREISMFTHLPQLDRPSSSVQPMEATL